MGKLKLFDVGGTFIKCDDGRSVPIDSNGSAEEITAAFKEAFGKLEDDDRIAIAMPGPFNYDTGLFLMKHKFAAVYGRTLMELLGNPKAEFRFVHDVNGMLLGEVRQGNGKGFDKIAMVTLGTGLGFSMCIDGKILKNENGSPLISIFNRPYKDGVLEDYASKRGFLRGYEGITVKDLADKAKAGDENAKARFDEVGRTISESICPILQEHGIECLLFGGQISRSFDLLEPSLKEGLTKVKSLKFIGPVSDIGNATFNGLKNLF